MCGFFGVGLVWFVAVPAPERYRTTARAGSCPADLHEVMVVVGSGSRLGGQNGWA